MTYDWRQRHLRSQAEGAGGEGSDGDAGCDAGGRTRDLWEPVDKNPAGERRRNVAGQIVVLVFVGMAAGSVALIHLLLPDGRRTPLVAVPGDDAARVPGAAAGGDRVGVVPGDRAHRRVGRDPGLAWAAAVAGGTVTVHGSLRARIRARRRSDGDLLDRAAGGDRDAFVALLRRHDDRLRGLAAKLLGSDRHRVDDALQEAYVRAYRALPGFRHDADVGTWLYRITYNACMDELRRAGRRPEPVDTAAAVWDRPSTASEPDSVVGAADIVDRALASLPPEQRGAVILVLGEGFDLATAAEILEVPLGTVASRLARGRAAIRLLVEEGHS